MLVGAVLAGALNAKLALNFWMDVNALLAVGACWEEFAVLLWMDIWTVFFTIHTVREMLASHLLFL
jgi:hypothetical protein